jgi:hypothetical protein
MNQCGNCGTYVDVTYYQIVDMFMCSNCAYLNGGESPDNDISFLEGVENFETDEDTEDLW